MAPDGSSTSTGSGRLSMAACANGGARQGPRLEALERLQHAFGGEHAPVVVLEDELGAFGEE
jgi:hypothetical protein